jgi:hypothetical protein
MQGITISSLIHLKKKYFLNSTNFIEIYIYLHPVLIVTLFKKIKIKDAITKSM